jgi:hypothetical protein
MACRLIQSPKTGKEETSLLWNELYNLSKDETLADEQYKQISSAQFIQKFGDWVNGQSSVTTNKIGEPAFGIVKQFLKDSTNTVSGTPALTQDKEKQQALAKKIDDRIKEYSIEKVAKDPEFEDDENRGYKRVVNGVKDWVKERVSDIVKKGKSPQTLAKFQNADKATRRQWDEQREYGNQFHHDMQQIGLAALDSEGYLKPFEQIDFSNLDLQLDESLKVPMIQYLVGGKDSTGTFVPGVLYTQFEPGTLFRIEQTVYDPKRDLAGTVDITGIGPTGKLRILDWKTKFLNKKKYDDVPFFNQRDYRVQLDQYRRVYATYGIDPRDVEVAQAQPIVFEGKAEKNGAMTLTALELPQVDPKKETRKYLIPVPVQDQKTGNAQIDKYVEELYKAYEEIGKTPNDDKELRNESLNAISIAIRELQVKQNFAPLAAEAQTFMAALEGTLKQVKEVFYKDGKLIESDPSLLPEGIKTFRELLKQLDTALDNIDKYAGLYGMFQNIYGEEELSDEQKKVQKALLEVSGKVGHEKERALEMFHSLMEWYATKYGVEGILQEERTVSGIFDRSFQSTSRIQTYAVELFYKMESEAKGKRDRQIEKETRGFQAVLEPFITYAKSKGLAAKDYFTLITEKGSNKLVRKLKKEAYDLFDKATDPRTVDTAWITKNVDLIAVLDEVEEKIKRYDDFIDGNRYSSDPEEDNETKEQKKENYRRLFDFTSSKSLGWTQDDLLRKHIKEELWYTPEYEDLKKQPEALALYQWIEEYNSRAAKLGYHGKNRYYSRRFLPWVQGTFLDKLGSSKGRSLLDNLQGIYKIAEEEEQTYGKSTTLSIPAPFTRAPEKGGVIDNSAVSTDLGRNMGLYIAAVENYGAMTEIEDIADAIVTLEKGKGHLTVNRNGDIALDKEGRVEREEGNEANARLLQEHVEMTVYGKMKDETSGLPAEADKAIDRLNKFTRLKIFGLSITMPFVNTMGSSLQAGINSGKLWRGRQWAANFGKVTVNSFKGEEGNKIKGLVDYFGALTEAPSPNRLSAEKLHRWSVEKILLAPVRMADHFVQVVTALTLVENTILAPDGRLVNAREYYRNSPEYKKVYDSKTPEGERSALRKGFEDKVKSLLAERGILQKAAFNKEGLLEIEGVDRESDSYHAFRQQIRNSIADITGQLTEEDRRSFERNAILKSFAMFKTWIPRLGEVRFGNLKKNAKTDEWELGRARICLRMLFYGVEGKRGGNRFTGIIQGFKDLLDMKAMNNRGLVLLQDYYEAIKKEYKARTNKDLTMTPEQFYEMTRQAIIMQIKDTMALTSLFLMYFGYSKGLPPDDEDSLHSKNVYRTVSRVLDKLHDELSFYYNPFSAQSILNTGIMPSLNVLTDGINTFDTWRKEIFGDEETREKTHGWKTTLKNFPLFYQGTQFFLPLIDPETAKDLGIKVAANNNFRR